MPVVVPSTIKQRPGTPFPIADSNDIKGGIHSVTNITQRNNIPANHRKEGMICYVKDVKGISKYYKLVGGIENSNWEEYEMGGSSASPIIFVDENGNEIEKQVRMVVGKNNSVKIIDQDGNVYYPETLASAVSYSGDKSAKNILDNLLYRVDKMENKVPVESLTLNKHTTILELGSKLQLTAEILPVDSNQSIIWSSTNPDVATVDDVGNVTPLSIGITIIKAQSADPKIIDSCEVIIAEEGNNDKEVTDGLVMKINHTLPGDVLNIWQDLSGNDNHVTIVGVTESTTDAGFIKGKTGFRTNSDGVYLQLPNNLMQSNCCLEIYADLLYEDNPYIPKKLFAKKETWSLMKYQVSTQDIMFGDKNGVASIETLSQKGKVMYTFNIDIDNGKIGIFINGDKYQIISMKEAGCKFGEGNDTPILISTHSTVDSGSDMIIYDVKVYDRLLSDSEVIDEYEATTGICDNLSNEIPSYAMSKGKWTESLPIIGIEDENYIKSYKIMDLEPGAQYELAIKNIIYNGNAESFGYNETKDEVVLYLDDILQFNNSNCIFTVPDIVYAFNFKLPIKTDVSVYYTLNKIIEEEI